MTDADDDAPVKLFGDPRSAVITRGPERRAKPERDESSVADARATLLALELERHHLAALRPFGVGRALRLGRGDGFATALNALGIVVFIGSLITGVLILNNAQDVGAFSNPWNSNRLAIGIAVLALGCTHSAILIGVARAITYQLASLRLKMRDVDSPELLHTSRVLTGQ